MKKVFFARTMRGGFPYVPEAFLLQLPGVLEDIGLELISKHQSQKGIIQQEDEKKSTDIYLRDLNWIKECDFVVAEISNPSDGTALEIGDAINLLGKPVIALYQRPENEMSMYERGKLESNPNCRHARYRDIEDFKRIVREFIDTIDNN